MARSKQNQQTPPAAAEEAVHGEQAGQGTTAAEDEAQQPEAGEADQQTPPAAAGDGGDRDPDPDPDPAEMVEALVLSDSVYGKCGEVKEFPAGQVEAIRAAGYIDPHPNAVKSAQKKD